MRKAVLQNPNPNPNPNRANLWPDRVAGLCAAGLLLPEEPLFFGSDAKVFWSVADAVAAATRPETSAAQSWA
jgi:hypothetical protein